VAFNNIGPVVTLAPGEAVRWDYDFNLADAGAQFAAPDVKTGGGRLTAFNQAKRRTASGGVIYSVDIRNDGNGVVRYNLQGGGFAFGFNNFLDVVTLAPGGFFQAQFRFAPFNEFPGDRGARFVGADIKSNDCQVVALLQGKEFQSVGIRYSALYRNNGPATAVYNFQGGGFSPGFNNLGDRVTIAKNETQLYHFFFGQSREDRGAQYASADVHTVDAAIVALSHSKERSPSGIDYYVTIRNDPGLFGVHGSATYNLQGGSLS
jgi:hypothetical protein